MGKHIQFSFWLCLAGVLLMYSGWKPGESKFKTLAGKQPNFLLCIADDASFPYMGAYGTEWTKTPHFDQVAKEGLLFLNAYTPNAKCAPSRASLLTGRNSWQLEEAANHWNYFPDKFKTVMEALGEWGYFTGHTAKGWAPGTVGHVNGKKRELTGKAYNSQTTEPPTTQISKTDYAGNFEKFLEEKPAEKPFCFWYGSTEPHRAYAYGSGKKRGKQTTEIDRVPAFWPDNDSVRTDMLDYALELEYFDEHLGRMLKMLEERGELENTVVIVTADNGMPFPRVKGQAYELSNHLPLAIMWKAGLRKPGRKIEDFVSFIDVAPTLLELAGLNQQKAGMQPVQGKSLTDILFSGKTGQVTAARNHVLIGKERHDVGRPHDWGYPIRGIISGNLLYLKNYETTRWPAGNPETGYLNTDGGATKSVILNMRRSGIDRRYWDYCFGKRGEEELYDIKADPSCMRNLILESGYVGKAAALRTKMEAELRKQGDPRMFGKGSVFDAYPYTDPSGVNFYERFKRGEKLNHAWVSDTDFERMPLED